jgi:hypothetical protein
MNHFATPDFWYLYRRLPTEVRLLADKNFALLRTDHNHPSLRLGRPPCASNEATQRILAALVICFALPGAIG